MCAPKAPAPPDPVATANAQTASNVATANNNAELNRVNQYTPYGSSTYSINGYSPTGTPQYSQTITLSPEQQSLYNQYTQGQQNLSNIALGMQGQVGNSYSSPINTSGLPGYSTGVSPTNIQGQVDSGDYSAQMKQAQDAAYRAQTQYLDPQFQQAQSSLDAKLANQGLQVGDAAYSRGQGDLARQKQAAYQSAQDAAVAAGNQEQNTLYGQRLASGQFANQAAAQQFAQGLSNAQLQNQAQQAGLQQLFALRNQPLNEYNALMSGAQVTNPTFNSIPGVNQANTDVAGITNQGYQNQLAAYNANQQGINNLFSLGGGLGAAAILASDRRLKRDIERIGTSSQGIPVYEFSYLWDEPGVRNIGLMADEVALIMPSAVIRHPAGFDMVDYSQVRP